MDPNKPQSQPQVQVPLAAPNEPVPSDDSSTNKKAIILVSVFAVVFVMGAAFAYYFLFIGPYSSGDKISSLAPGQENQPTVSPPTPTPTVNPWLIIKQAYANPFEEDTEYVNPFEEENPFEDLE